MFPCLPLVALCVLSRAIGTSTPYDEAMIISYGLLDFACFFLIVIAASSPLSRFAVFPLGLWTIHRPRVLNGDPACKKKNV